MSDNHADRPADDDDIDYDALSAEQRAVISREMLEVGVMAYLRHDSRFESDEVAVANIYLAMSRASGSRPS